MGSKGKLKKRNYLTAFLNGKKIIDLEPAGLKDTDDTLNIRVLPMVPPLMALYWDRPWLAVAMVPASVDVSGVTWDHWTPLSQIVSPRSTWEPEHPHDAAETGIMIMVSTTTPAARV